MVDAKSDRMAAELGWMIEWMQECNGFDSACVGHKVKQVMRIEGRVGVCEADWDHHHAWR